MLVESCGKYPCAQEGMAGAAIHLSLHGLDAIDLTFDRACAPRFSYGRTNGSQISDEALCEAGKFAFACGSEPGIEFCCLTTANHGREPSR
jgi:hypothetical protein